jgi:hypothetical protein
VRDNWKVTNKLTVNYGIRWEKYPVPTSPDRGIYIMDLQALTLNHCGEGSTPLDCGIKVSNKIFAPSLGIAYRPTDRTVFRVGYSLSPSQLAMGTGGFYSFPVETTAIWSGDSSWTPANWTATNTSYTLSQGLVVLTPPPSTNGVYPIVRATGNLSGQYTTHDYVRGYLQSWNVTVQREFGHGWLGSAGYVGMHSVHMQTSVNMNYGQIGGGAASQPLWAGLGISGAVSIPQPFGTNQYNGAYTWSKDIGLNTSILIPAYMFMDRYVSSADRTHHLALSGAYQLPFGKGKPYLQKSVGAYILGGWTASGIFNRWSGTPFTVSSSASSLNAPGNSQVADLVNPNVTVVGTGVGGEAYFDPMAYAPVKGARFGTSGFDQLRGPGSTNIDLGVFRSFKITERWNAQIRAEALNATNTPHFSNPSANVSNRQLNSDGTLKSLGGFSQITSAQLLGRLIDQRYFRFAFRINF